MLNRVGVDDGRVREDDDPSRRRLRLDPRLFEKQRGGAGACAGEQLAPTERAAPDG